MTYSQGPGLQAVGHSLKIWEQTIYLMPPFLWQEVAPRALVLLFENFPPTLSGFLV